MSAQASETETAVCPRCGKTWAELWDTEQRTVAHKCRQEYECPECPRGTFLVIGAAKEQA